MARQGQVGRFVDKGGHWLIYQPSHRRAHSNGYVYEHVLIAERALGKPLPPKAQIHHWGASTDNTKLVICEDLVYHKLIHLRADALRATGSPTARRCSWCGRYGEPTNPADKMSLVERARSPRGSGVAYHRVCATKYQRQRSLRRSQ